MGWLGKRKKPSHEEEEEEERRRLEAEAKAARSAKAGPPLVLLVPDVAGVSSYRMHHLLDAPAGAAFIQSSLTWQKKSGIHAFWALQDEPEATPESGPERGDEAMVLIRTADGSDLVYVVSFVDIESAQSFARFEVKRGLNLGLILIYWACPVTVAEAEDGIRLSPEFPPRVELGPSSREPKASTAVPVADQRRSQQEEKRKAQAELAEMQRRQAMAEQRRLQIEEKKRLQAELAEMQRRQAEAEEARKQTEVERARGQASAEQAGSRLLEAEESARLQTGAAEIAQLKAQAQALRKLQAEAREITKLKQEAEALRQQLADAEEQARKEQRESDAEEKGRPASEGEVAGRRPAEIEETQRLQAELADVQRRQAEAEERHRQAEAQETQTREALEETHQQAEVQQPLSAAEQAMFGEPVEAVIKPVPELEDVASASADEVPLLETIAGKEDTIDDWPPRMPANGSRPIAETTIARGPADDHAREAITLESALDKTPGRDETETAEEPIDQVIARFAARFEQAAEHAGEEPPVDEVTDVLGSLQESDEAFAAEPQVSEVEPVVAGATIPELPAEIPPEFARDAVAASVAAETTTDGPLDDSDAGGQIPAEVSKLMGKQRWEKRDSPFKGFDSPPGRF